MNGQFNPAQAITSKGVAVVMGNPQAQEHFIQSLLDILNDERYGFTGVCIDFEGLKSEPYRQDFAAFLRELKEKLGNGKTLTVAIPPNYYYKGYDEKAIGETADSL